LKGGKARTHHPSIPGPGEGGIFWGLTKTGGRGFDGREKNIEGEFRLHGKKDKSANTVLRGVVEGGKKVQRKRGGENREQGEASESGRVKNWGQRKKVNLKEEIDRKKKMKGPGGKVRLAERCGKLQQKKKRGVKEKVCEKV